MNSPDRTKYQLVPESECDDQQDFPDDEQMHRDIASAIQDITAFERGERKLRTSEFVNGQWLDREETGPELEVRRAAEQDAEQIARYTVLLWWSERDNAFLAKMPELPGCMADGATQEEALQHIREVARMWIETARSMGREIPEPGTFEVAA